MLSHSRSTAWVLTALLVGMVAPAQAEGGDTRLYRVADRYRDAVQEFERLVRRNDHLGRRHERVADALEDATARLRSATRNPRRIDRLTETWREVAELHQRTEAIVFANPVFPGRAVLAGQWVEINAVFGQLGSIIEVVFSGYGGGFGADFWYPPIIAPPVYYPPIYPPICYPPAPSPGPQTDPFSGGNHPSQWNPNRGVDLNPPWTQTPSGSWRGRMSRAQISGQQ